METIIIDRICTSCRCDKETAREYLDAEVRNLRELCKRERFAGRRFGIGMRQPRHRTGLPAFFLRITHLLMVIN